MPELDVSFMCADPMFADTFRVTRRADVVNDKGRTSANADEVIEGVMGVVTQEDPADLVRTPEGQRVPRVIFIATTFPLRSVNTGIQPDIITWDCADYMVIEVKPYSRFGAGTYQARAQSIAATQRAPAG